MNQSVPLSLPDKVHMKWELTSVSSILPYHDKGLIKSYCREGCEKYNQNWSCPPHSPSFSQLSQGFHHIFLLVLYIESQNQEPIFTRDYEIIKRLSETITNSINTHLDGQIISGNSCELCEYCTLLIQKPCAYPNSMKYNFTSLGFNMAALSEEILYHKLIWPQTPNQDVYISCFSGILLPKKHAGPNQRINVKNLLAGLIQNQEIQ